MATQARGGAGRAVAGALQTLRIEVLPALQGHPPSRRAGAGRMRGVLLAGQVAMTPMLVIGAGLFLRSLRAAVTTDVGVDADRPEYVRTVGLALQSGRDIGPRDVEGSEPVAVVNESLARHLWPDRSPLGQRFTFKP